MLQAKKPENILSELTERIKQLLSEKEYIIVAIDGRCASGKTTLATMLQKKFQCNIVHADDFFLRPHQRTLERLSEPGGNVDYERMLEEVLIPLKANGECTYRPYDCKTQSLKAPVKISFKPVTIIEGSYSCHPKLWEYYDLRMFMTVDKTTQRARIENRNKENAEMFFEKWIPLEERYFTAFSIEERSDMVKGKTP